MLKDCCNQQHLFHLFENTCLNNCNGSPFRSVLIIVSLGIFENCDFYLLMRYFIFTMTVRGVINIQTSKFILNQDSNPSSLVASINDIHIHLPKLLINIFNQHCSNNCWFRNEDEKTLYKVTLIVCLKNHKGANVAQLMRWVLTQTPQKGGFNYCHTWIWTAYNFVLWSKS